MDIKAELNYLRISPRKVRLTASLIRGMDIKRAELELNHIPKRSALPLLKLLRSAVANAEHNFSQDREGLYVKEIRVDEGPVLKRSMPRAFGRASVIRKRMSHVSLLLGVRGSGASADGFVPKDQAGAGDRNLRSVKKYGTDSRRKKQASPELKAQKAAAGKGFAKRVFRRKAI